VTSTITSSKATSTTCAAGTCTYGALTTTVTASSATVTYTATSVVSAGATVVIGTQTIVPSNVTTLVIPTTTICIVPGVYILGGLTKVVTAQTVIVYTAYFISPTTSIFWINQVFAGQTITAAAQAVTSTATVPVTTSTYVSAAGTYTIVGEVFVVSGPQYIYYVIFQIFEYVCEAAQCLGSAPTKSINVYAYQGTSFVTAYGLLLIDVIFVDYKSLYVPFPTIIIDINISINVTVAPTTITYPVTSTTTSTVTVTSTTATTTTATTTNPVVPVTSPFSFVAGANVIAQDTSTGGLVYVPSSSVGTGTIVAISFTIDASGNLFAASGAGVSVTFTDTSSGPMVLGGAVARRKRETLTGPWTVGTTGILLNGLGASVCGTTPEYGPVVNAGCAGISFTPGPAVASSSAPFTNSTTSTTSALARRAFIR